MTIRRPDARTIEQRHRERTAILVEGLRRQLRAKAIARAAFLEVYREEVQRGTTCRVLGVE